MVEHAVAAARDLDPQRLAVVVRHQRDKVAQHILDFDTQVTIVDQDDIPGTGRAVEVGLNALDTSNLVDGTVLVTYGDVPLLRAETLRELMDSTKRDAMPLPCLPPISKSLVPTGASCATSGRSYRHCGGQRRNSPKSWRLPKSTRVSTLSTPRFCASPVRGHDRQRTGRKNILPMYSL